ncbi:hypothetical protein HAX54_030083 [Datura stramonium]|uniref:Uncharacterized protein n=1 Tax=Datura stramonium TaxID=4076 RepID=A0ABS8V9V4_DATST|nr:hypothetical protein [Datura stramonium]
MMKFLSLSYKSWWEKVRGNFLEIYMQFLVNVVGLVTNAFREHNEERPSQDERSSSHEDHCWKKVKPSLDEPRDTNLHVVEISDNNDHASSLKEEVRVILEDMYGKDTSILANIAAEVEKSESFVKVKEHFDLVLSEKDEKLKKLSGARQSLKEAKKKVKELKAFEMLPRKELNRSNLKSQSLKQSTVDVLMFP